MARQSRGETSDLEQLLDQLVDAAEACGEWDSEADVPLSGLLEEIEQARVRILALFRARRPRISPPD